MTRAVGYFDVETFEWATFVVGATLSPGRQSPELHWGDAGAMLDAMVARPDVEWRAHYGGRFDALLLATLLSERGWRMTVVTRGAGVLKLTAYRPGQRKAALLVTDTYALAPVSLAKFARAAGGTQKCEWNHERTRPGMKPPDADAVELGEYLAADVLSLRDADTAWRHTLREVSGVEPGLTLGGTAWRSAVKYLADVPEDVMSAMDRHAYRDGRAGYYGGRVEVLRTQAPAVWRYDRNSSYPAALTRQPVPVGERRWRRTWNGEDGTVWARVTVPESRHPMLPVRLRERLVYPTGTFEGAWTSIELKAALDAGAKMEHVLCARVANETTDALGAWCWHVWRARQERTEWGTLLKLLANSLTGKLAQRPERSTTSYSHKDALPAGAELLTWTPDAHGHVWFRTHAESVSPCARPEWSAYLTAEARIELGAQLAHAGSDSAYCDTDSVYSLRPLTRSLGSELGQWKHEGVGDGWEARAPKLYRYDVAGQTHVRARGQRGLTPEGFERLVADGTPWESSEGVLSLLTAIRGNGRMTFERQHLRRGLAPADEWVGGRLRGTAGDTRAPTYAEALARWGR